MSETQRCYECDEPTGRCEDDTMYSFDEFPLCEDCFHNRKDVSRLSAELAPFLVGMDMLLEYPSVEIVTKRGSYFLSNKSLQKELTEAKKECEALRWSNELLKSTMLPKQGEWLALEAELATLRAELEQWKDNRFLQELIKENATLKETKEACGVLASITKTFGGMRDNASYEAEIAILKAENSRLRGISEEEKPKKKVKEDEDNENM